MTHSPREHATDSQGTPAHALAETTRSKIGSGASTPRKRKPRRRSKKKQHLFDPTILQGGKFSGAPTFLLEGDAGKNIDPGAEESASSALPAPTAVAPGEFDKEDSGQVAGDCTAAVQTDATATAPPQSVTAHKDSPRHPGRSGIVTDRDKATQQASLELANAREQIDKLKEEDTPSLHRIAQEHLHVAQVDYYYCVHFPQDQPFRPPPGPRPDPFKRSKHSAIRLERQRMWDLVDRHLKEGSLALLGESLSERKLTQLAGLAQSTTSRPMGSDKASTISATPSSERDLEEAMSRDGVMINTYDAVQGDASLRKSSMDEESGEEGELLPSARQKDEERLGPEQTTRGASEEGGHSVGGADSRDGDAMMDYANSNGFERKAIIPELAQTETAFRIAVRGLSELNPEELKLQLRYFHAGKSLIDADDSMPSKCLACGRSNHDAGKCEFLNCQNCGAKKAHLTDLCPVNTKCSKCRESGHTSLSCHYKLKTLAPDEIVCDICQRCGHVEEDCELIWRTSGSPWTFDPSSYIVHLSCYECGRSGHLGNDCPSRRPNKPLGTSSWTVCQKYNVPARSEEKFTLPAGPKRVKGGELRIRGKAQYQQNSLPQEDNDEEPEFLGSKRIRQTGPPTPIKISSLGNHRVDYGGPRRPPSSAYGQNASNISRSRLPDTYTHRTGSAIPRPIEAFHNSVDDDHWRKGRIRGRSRSRSPIRRDREASYGHHAQTASRSAPEANQGINRSMPGAAQRPWNKHRF